MAYNNSQVVRGCVSADDSIIIVPHRDGQSINNTMFLGYAQHRSSISSNMFTPPPAMIAGSVANATTPDHIAADNGAVACTAAIAAAAALPSLPAIPPKHCIANLN